MKTNKAIKITAPEASLAAIRAKAATTRSTSEAYLLSLIRRDLQTAGARQ